MTSLFAPAPAGIGINFMRVPVTSCDLIEPAGAVPWWTFDDTPGDVQLTHFNSSQALEYQIPVLQDVMAIVRATGGQMRLVGTPWTAPTWIKDSNSWYGGSIIDSYYPFYAQCTRMHSQTTPHASLPAALPQPQTHRFFSVCAAGCQTSPMWR